MKINVAFNARYSAVAATLLCLMAVPGAPATTPQYQIYDIGIVQVGDTASQGFGVSHGDIAVGRSIRTGGSQAFTWTLNGGIVGLPNLSGDIPQGRETKSFLLNSTAVQAAFLFVGQANFLNEFFEAFVRAE